MDIKGEKRKDRWTNGKKPLQLTTIHKFTRGKKGGGERSKESKMPGKIIRDASRVWKLSFKASWTKRSIRMERNGG